MSAVRHAHAASMPRLHGQRVTAASGGGAGGGGAVGGFDARAAANVNPATHEAKESTPSRVVPIARASWAVGAAKVDGGGAGDGGRGMSPVLRPHSSSAQRRSSTSSLLTRASSRASLGGSRVPPPVAADVLGLAVTGKLAAAAGATVDVRERRPSGHRAHLLPVPAAALYKDLQLSASQRHKHTPERGGVSVRVDDATGTSADATGTAAAVAAGAVAWLGPSSRPSSATLLQSRPRSRRVRNNNSSSNNNNSSSSSNVHHRARGRALGGGVSGGVSGRDMSRSRSEVMMNDPDVRAALLHSALNSATHVHGDGGATVGRRGTLGVGVYGTSLATALSMDSHPDAQRIARQLDAALAPMPNTTSDVGASPAGHRWRAFERAFDEVIACGTGFSHLLSRIKAGYEAQLGRGGTGATGGGALWSVGGNDGTPSAFGNGSGSKSGGVAAANAEIQRLRDVALRQQQELQRQFEHIERLELELATREDSDSQSDMEALSMGYPTPRPTVISRIVPPLDFEGLRLPDDDEDEDVDVDDDADPDADADAGDADAAFADGPAEDDDVDGSYADTGSLGFDNTGDAVNGDAGIMAIHVPRTASASPLPDAVADADADAAVDLWQEKQEQ